MTMARLWHGSLFCLLLLASVFALLPAPLQAQATEDCFEYGDLRVVLSWNTNQTDIDLHTYDPRGYHSWYGNLGGIPGGSLDYDDVDGFGPETFYMMTPVTGTYQIRVHYYNDHNQVAAASGAKSSKPPTPAATNGTLAPDATATQASVQVYIGGILKFSASHTLTGVGEWWETYSFTICGGKPVITAVTPKYKLDNTRFLKSINAENLIKVNVNWLGHSPGQVEFKLNDQVIAKPQANGNLAQHTINMGTALQDGKNKLQITAYAGANNEIASDPKTFEFYSASQPEWLLALVLGQLSTAPTPIGGFSSSSSDGYEVRVLKLPNQPFQLDLDKFGPPDGKLGFDWELKGMLKIPFDCVSVPSAQLTGSGEFEYFYSKLKFSGTVGVESQREGICWFQPPTGFAEGKIEFTQNIYRKPVLVMITYFNAAIGATVDLIVVSLHIEQYVGRFGEFYIDGNVNAQAKTLFKFGDRFRDGLIFEDLTYGGGLGLQGGFRADIEVAELDVWAGASGEIAYKRPGVITLPIFAGAKFDKVTLKGEVGAKFRVLWATRETKGEISWTHPGALLAADASAAPVFDSGWQLIPPASGPRELQVQLAPSANQVFARAATSVASAANGAVAALTESSLLVSNVYTYPETTLALNPTDGRGMLLWVQAESAKPVGQAQEIYFSQWNGATWSTPAGLTNDLLLDAAPQVGPGNAGQFVAVWQRLKETLPPAAPFDLAALQKVEIATATYDPASNAWSAPALLTDNTVLDMEPRLAHNGNGQNLAVWRRNAANLLIGDDTNPDQIMSAFYTTAWQTPVLAVDNIPGLRELAVAYQGNAAALVYNRDVVVSPVPTPTAQLFLSTWSGTAWSAPQALTATAHDHNSPQVLYNDQGELLLLWLANGQLHLRNLTTNVERLLLLPATLTGLDEFRALRDPQGNLVATFVNQNLLRNLYLVYYDATLEVWSQPRQLTTDAASERDLAPIFDSANQLLLGYASTALNLVVQPTTLNNVPLTYTVPLPGQTDLRTLVHSFAQNVSIANVDLATSQTNPTPGDSIILTATVHNSGDKAVAGLDVAFYDSNFGLIHTASRVAPLPGNTTTVFTTTYLVPDNAGGLIQVWIDPTDVIAESDESDNVAQLIVNGPDLVVTEATVRYWGGANADLITTIRNVGRAATTATTLKYRLADASDTLLASAVIPALNVDDVVTRTTYLNLATLPSGRYLVYAVAEEPSSAETDLDNNQRSLILQILPDLATPPAYLRTSPLTAETITASLSVFNSGVAPSRPVVLSFYRSEAALLAGRLFTTTLGVITPTAGVTIPAQLIGPLCALHVVVDGENSQDELLRSNNSATVRGAQPICADFAYSESAVAAQAPSAPQARTVQFFDMSYGNITTRQWNFGDGTTSNAVAPAHTYTTPGIYTVTLTISGPEGSDTRQRPGLIQVTAPPNRNPTAGNDAGTTTQGIALQIAVLANDSDPDGDTLILSTVSPPQQGSAEIAGAQIRYTPAAGFVGDDTFTYTVSDGKGGTATATVVVTVRTPLPSNRTPTATADSFMIRVNSQGTLLNVLGNDSDADGDTLTILAVSAPQQGSAAIENNQVRYTLITSNASSDSFTYTVSDGRGGTATATVSITVQPSPAVYLPLVKR